MTIRQQRIVLAACALLVAGSVVLVALRGSKLDPVASAVVQVLGVVLSVYGAIVFTKEGNDRTVRAAARSSARRVLVYYESLRGLALSMEKMRRMLHQQSEPKEQMSSDAVDLAFEGLLDQVATQIASADAAIRDWRDLAPTEVDEELAVYRRGSDGK